MIVKSLLSILIVFLNTIVSAQTKGVVKDSISGNPISFANIWIENENIATTSEENGNYTIYTTSKSKKLIFTAIGFENKIVKLANASEVLLKPISYNLQEINILKKLEKKQIEIGKSSSKIYLAFDNGPKIDVKFFPYKPSYKKTKFIQQVRFQTDSKIDAAIVKIHFFEVDSLGFPGKELLKENLLITVKKGINNSRINLSERNLIMPKTGIYVGFEKLHIENNKVGKSFAPFILYSREEREYTYTFSGGKWNKETRLSSNGLISKFMVFEPAINLILSN